MRKFGLDEGKQHIEQCTLLEPNNFIPSWVSLTFFNESNSFQIQEAGDEEKKEVSLALKKLRKKFDDIHKATSEK